MGKVPWQVWRTAAVAAVLALCAFSAVRIVHGIRSRGEGTAAGNGGTGSPIVSPLMPLEEPYLD